MRPSSSITDYEYKEQMTIYKGQVVTLAQAIALKARDRRKKKEAEAKKRITFDKSEVFPSVLQHIEKTFKSTRTIKSFCAFCANGPIQWSADFPALMETYPGLNRLLIKYKRQYRVVSEVFDNLGQLLKRHKRNRNFIAEAEKFGYEMSELIDCLNEIVNVVTKQHVLSHPCFYRKEIIIGSSDGRRLGLKQIIARSTESISKAKSNLIKLQLQLIQAYKDVFEY